MIPLPDLSMLEDLPLIDLFSSWLPSDITEVLVVVIGILLVLAIKRVYFT